MGIRKKKICRLEYEAPLLHEAVEILSRMTEDLDRQIENLEKANSEMKSNLRKEREKANSLKRERDEMQIRVTTVEKENIELYKIKGENKHLLKEIAYKERTIEECGRQLAESTQQNVKYQRLVERTRNERDDAFEEAQSVEAQLERALIAASEINMRMNDVEEERERMNRQLMRVQYQLELTEKQRDELSSAFEDTLIEQPKKFIF